METNDSQKASVGKLLKWATRASNIDHSLLLVSVGRIGPSYPHHFQFYNEKELDEIGKSGKTAIFRNLVSTSEYSLAHWIITDACVTGIHLETKVSTSLKPTIKVVDIIAFPLGKGDVKTLSQGGIVESKPDSEYELKGITRIGPQITEIPYREPRADFPGQGELNLKVKALEVVANKSARNDADIFSGRLTFINRDTTPIVILESSAEWRLVGEKEWKKTELKMEVPFSCETLIATTIPYNVIITDPKKTARIYDRSWVARHKPIRIRFNYEDVNGRKGSQIVEYVNKNMPLEKEGANDLLFLTVDDTDSCDRYGVHITKDSYGENIITVAGTGYKEADFRQIVWKASNGGSTEHELTGRSSDYFDYKVWALVDISCQRVYALKVLVWNTTAASLGYVKVDLYGSTETSAAIQLAEEVVTLPEIATAVLPDVSVQDDDFDDKVHVVAVPTSSEGLSSGGGCSGSSAETLVVLSELSSNLGKMVEAMSKLDSIDRNLNRLADSFDRLVGVLEKK